MVVPTGIGILASAIQSQLDDPTSYFLTAFAKATFLADLNDCILQTTEMRIITSPSRKVL
jgi:hypothetical protein